MARVVPDPQAVPGVGLFSDGVAVVAAGRAVVGVILPVLSLNLSEKYTLEAESRRDPGYSLESAPTASSSCASLTPRARSTSFCAFVGR